jgi:hypothetical protein
VDKGEVEILLHGGEELEEGIHDKKLFSRLCSEWEHWKPADEKLKDHVRTHWMEDDEVDKLEEEGGDEKEWWDKVREEGYTSECDPVDWDLDDEVQEREIGYTGKKRV